MNRFFFILVALLLTTTVASQSDPPYTWHTYEMQTFSISYPLEYYSARKVCSCQYESDLTSEGLSVHEVIDLLPNDSLNFAEPLMVTYSLRYASYENTLGYTANDLPGLFGTLPLIQYDSALAQNPEGIRVGEGAPPAVQVNNIPVGMSGIEAHILVLSWDRQYIYEIVVEQYQTSGDTEPNRLLLNTLISGLEPLTPE